jgi:ribosomal protein L22
MENNKQIVSATSRYIRVAPSKIDVIIAKIRGKSYKEALQILKYLPQNWGYCLANIIFCNFKRNE